MVVLLNDMWKYNLTSNTWVYLSGDKKFIYSDYVVPYHGSVHGHNMVIDSIDQYLYVFGGASYHRDKISSLILYC